MIRDDARMTFTEHLGELRTRLIRSCTAILVCFILCYIVREQVFQVVARPLKPLTHGGIIVDDTAPGTAPVPPETPANGAAEESGEAAAPTWTVLNPMEPFLVQLKLSFYAGFILALPILIYQLCAFVFPGLKPSERKLVRILIVGASIFVLFGVATAYFAVFPMVMPYLATWVPPGVEVQFRMSETVSLILKGLMGFAIAFQFPMVVMVLVYLDLLSPETLRKYRRVSIVLLAVGSAAFTPPDPISMMAMLIPLYLLYEMSIWLAVFMVKKRRQKDAAADTLQG